MDQPQSQILVKNKSRTLRSGGDNFSCSKALDVWLTLNRIDLKDLIIKN